MEEYTLVCVGEGVTPYNGLYMDAPPERGTFFRLQIFHCFIKGYGIRKLKYIKG